MPRPRKRRFVGFEHRGPCHFRPMCEEGKDSQPSTSELPEEIRLTIDELEAMRLSYLEKLNQSEGAARMQIHQSTFQRSLKKALEKITDAFVNGKAIKIEGGNYRMPSKDGTGPYGEGPLGGQGRGQGRGKGRGFGFGGPEGTCVCPSCGYEAPHQPGMPCARMKCDKCGTPMVRKA